MDRIMVSQIPLRAHVGVTEHERADEQDIFVDFELGLDLAAAGKDDALDRTVDYEKACDLVTNIVGAKSFQLIESIAEACAQAMLDAFQVAEVRVRVRKPGALRSRGVPYAAVEVVRRRDP